jgi:hypothetical protein
MHDKLYAELLSGIQFGQGACHPDLAFASNLLSHFLHNPGQAHWNALVHLCQYIIGTKEYGLTFQCSNDGLTPVTYCDANHAACIDTHHSTSGIVTMLAGAPVFWMAKCQDVVAILTMELEYIAYSKGTQQMKWVYNFLSEIGHPSPLPSQLLADNTSTIAISENPKFHQCIKHIDICYHFLHDLVKSREVKISYVPSDNNLTDILTKPLSKNLHCHQVQLMGLDSSIEWA